MTRLLDRPFRFTFLCFIFVALMMSIVSAPVRAQQHTLHILYDQPVALKFAPATASADGQTGQTTSERYVKSASVLVRNDGERLDTLIFSVRIPDKADEKVCVDEAGKATCVNVDLDPSHPQDKSIDAFAVKEFDLQFSVNNPADGLTGYLIVAAPGTDVVPGTMPLTLNRPMVSRVLAWLPQLLLSRLEYLLVILSWVAAVIVAIVAYRCIKPLPQLTQSVEMEKGFSFNESLASTLTGIGALLGTVLAAGVLPEDTQMLSKESYALLNLFFGGLVLVAGLIYAVSHKEESGTEKISVWAFLLASGITLWATFGELLTVALLVEEMEVQGTVSPLFFWLLHAMLIIAFAGAGIYLCRGIHSRLSQEPTAPEGVGRAEILKRRVALM